MFAKTAKVNTPNKFREIWITDESILYVRADYRWIRKTLDFDASCHFWVFVMAEVPSGHLRMGRRGEKIPVEGKSAIFIPPFSLVEWNLGLGQIRFEAAFSTLELPDYMPKEPVLIHPSECEIPRSSKEIFETVVKHSHVPVGKEEKSSAIARRSKQMIDQGFDKGLRMSEVASRLDISPAQLTRGFKENYGLAPLTYTNLLRLMDSWRLMLIEGASVNETAFEVGFRDVSRFYQQFKKRNGVPPSEYLRNRPLPANE